MSIRSNMAGIARVSSGRVSTMSACGGGRGGGGSGEPGKATQHLVEALCATASTPLKTAPYNTEQQSVRRTNTGQRSGRKLRLISKHPISPSASRIYKSRCIRSDLAYLGSSQLLTSSLGTCTIPPHSWS
ncbi:hypothetical protein M011DRAFT_280642 [Sporormia fimetaria CBS 119925]|uniref:Uncharacterized protein n=1 Tax=Sporormia fimetaria CBS 119925 TaxID=1340428 RepID=A0A6A6VJ85_9PLEO|nr:hypothetical protein M011DRAFT_280642 [Sporormia fimetaria CBS 119925]